MNVQQTWVVVGFMVAALTGLVTAMFRLISVQGSRMTEGFAGIRSEIAGLRNEVDKGDAGLRNELTTSVNGLRNELSASVNGVRNEVHASFHGLRNEMNTRFDHLETRLERVEKIDREVHALTLKVFGDNPPRSP